MTFQLTEQDWADAEEALIGKPSGTKLSKYPQELDRLTPYKVKWIQLRKHSFVIINNIIYALSNKESFKPLVENSAFFKKGLTKEGKEVIIKIQDLKSKKRFLKNNHDDPNQTFTNLNFLCAKNVEYEKPLNFDQRIYTVIEQPTNSLQSKITFNDQSAPFVPPLIFSLRACLLIQQLHNQGIVYRNIKAESFYKEINDQNVQLKFLNLDFCLFTRKKDCVDRPILDVLSLIGFMSPETFYKQEYSSYSDIFSLAIMLIFQYDITGKNVSSHYFDQYINDACHAYSLGLYQNPIEWIKEKNIIIEPKLKEILFGMLHSEPEKRTSITKIIVYLCEKLILNKFISTDLIEECNSLINYYNPSPTLIFSPFDLPDIFSELRIGINANPLHMGTAKPQAK